MAKYQDSANSRFPLVVQQLGLLASTRGVGLISAWGLVPASLREQQKKKSANSPSTAVVHAPKDALTVSTQPCFLPAARGHCLHCAFNDCSGPRPDSLYQHHGQFMVPGSTLSLWKSQVLYGFSASGEKL